MGNLRFWQKTYLLTLLLFLAALFGGILFIGWQNQQQMMNREIEKAKREQHFVAQSLSRDLSAIQSNIHLRIPALIRSYGQYYAQDGILLEVRNTDEVLFSTLPPYSGTRPELLVEEGTQNWMTRQIDGATYSIVASRLSDELETYTLVYARSLEPLTAAWAEMQKTLAVSGVLVSLLLAVGLFFVLRSLSKPLEKLARSANLFAEGDFSIRAIQKGNDEIGTLADSFNAMADTAVQNITEIGEVAQQNARMAANLSHEIRTPLTAIQGYAEYMRLAELSAEEQNSALAYIISESSRLQKIAQRMLQLSTLEHEVIELEPVCLATCIEQAVQAVRPKAEKAGLTLNVAAIADMQIMGDAILLESLLINLLDNAIKACSEGGKVSITIQREESLAVLEITDTGRGLSEEEIGRLGEPFYRPDKARSRKEGGAGLGVALCTQIAALHHAELHYTSAVQQGTTVTLKFTAL